MTRASVAGISVKCYKNTESYEVLVIKRVVASTALYVGQSP